MKRDDEPRSRTGLPQGPPDPSRGRFVVLDGIDGCGKTTQAARLVRALQADSRLAPLHLREPGSTALGERVRAALLDPGLSMEAGVETLLFAAARRQMLIERVEPNLEAGRDVVCERFHASTFAYQAVAGELGEEPVMALLESWAGAPRPDLVIVLELSVELSAQRRDARVEDRIEGKGLEFQELVAAGYRAYVERDPRALSVCAEGSEDEVAARVFEAFTERLGRAEVKRAR